MKNNHKLGVIVPYRDRAQHLVKFIPYITDYLNNQNINFEIFIIEQKNYDLSFNKGMLFNIGVSLLDKSFDYVVLHDVDLLPITFTDYSYPEMPTHLISHYIENHDDINIYVNYVDEKNEFAEKYIIDNKINIAKKVYLPNGFGGIVKMTIDDYKKINGFSNEFWGWGFEDDDLLERVKKANVLWQRKNAGFVISLPHAKYNQSTNNAIENNKQQLQNTRNNKNKNKNGFFELNNFEVIKTEKFKLFTKHNVRIGR